MTYELKTVIAKYWLIAFFILISIFMLVFDVNIRDIFTIGYALNYWQIILLLLVFSINSFVHILSRKYLLFALDAKCGLKNLIYIHFSTLAAHYTTPAKIGFPLAVFLLNKFENVAYSKGTSMVLIELVIGTGLCGLIALVYMPNLIDISKLQIFLLIITVLTIGIILFYIFSHFATKINSNNRIANYIFNTFNAIKNIDRKKLLVYLLFAMSLRFIDAINLFLLSFFYSENLTILQSVIATSAAFFVGAVSMVPMGIGTRDISLLLFLQHYEIDNTTAIVIVTLQRILSTGLGFMLGIVFGGLLGIKNISFEKQTPENNE